MDIDRLFSDRKYSEKEIKKNLERIGHGF